MPEFIKSAKRPEDFPDSSSEIIFIGKSNVGKSSLINALYGKSTAYVGKTPGKTKMLNFFSLGEGRSFADAPGYGYAKRSDQELIDFGDLMEGYFNGRKALKLAILILDVRHVPTKDDMDMYEYLKEKKIPFIVVFNKTDKLSGNELFKQKKLFRSLFPEDLTSFYVSAYRKQGTEELKEYLDSRY